MLNNKMTSRPDDGVCMGREVLEGARGKWCGRMLVRTPGPVTMDEPGLSTHCMSCDNRLPPGSEN